MKSYTLIIFCLLFCTVSYSQVSLEKYLPTNYVKDGTVDYTIYLQKGFEEHIFVQLPNFPILINERGLNVKCNQRINFLTNSKLVMKSNAKERYGILNIKYVNNVVVNNPILIGDKESHLGDKGEWGMGINIWASTNITINNPQISKTWGDGIYIGEPTIKERLERKLNSYTNHNISILGGVIDDCLRNGISIVSGVNVLIDGVTIKNMNTKAPKGAIDIEPNGTYNELRNISLKNITTKNNFNGIIIFLVNLAKEKKYDIGEILVENHKDFNSTGALVIRNYHKKYKKMNGVSGKIIINEASYYGTKNVYNHHPDIKFNPIIEFSDVKYYKQSKNEFILDSEANKAFEESVNKDPNVKIIK